ncbi:MAG: pilus (MSHA type) biogenesis protein MshL [Pseudomonadota bacterium]
MKIMYALMVVLGLTACSTSPTKPSATFDRINDEIKAANSRAAAARPEAVDKALLPPLQAGMPRPAQPSAEPRFDLVVNNAPAAQVFMAIVSGTRYSMLLHPELAGTISVNLKDVTVREALETIRELYGYEFKVQGTRLFIQPLTMQTRIFQVNYLAGRRQGASDVRVASGSIASGGSGNGSNGSSSGSTASSNSGSSGSGNSGGASQRAPDSSRIYTTTDSDFWTDLATALRAIVGSDAGRQVIVNTMSGVIVVRAFPTEQRSVEEFLRATQVIVERQVMLEAKILEVQLSDGYEAGINWASFDAAGALRSAVGASTTSFDLNGAAAAGTTLGGALGSGFNSASGRTDGGVFGLAFRTKSFASLLQFLESQGSVQVLSSPRIATLNNQKAVLKVGTDEFFITNVSTSTTTTGTTATVSPTITTEPFFSGIALDVTPQIDEHNNIILHIHPSITNVAEKTKNINLGSLGNFTIPLASSTVNETDSVVRAQDGGIVAIGGLMKQSQSEDRSGVPGVGEVPVLGAFFGQRSKSFLKKEVVVLLKPTIIQGDRWRQDLLETQERIQGYDPRIVEPRQWPPQ